ncbi:DUF2088 domain-containing protein, partial [candidate division KSB3 bacterium]|nr:DUF2088 domain-containing protein [candidate division KSB3 bacterium]MBD3323484.1 DUF2088 domain-containing protein [candidate division KSB3 bacterium]
MRIDFPYADVRPLEIPSTYAVQTFDLPPQAQPSRSEAEIVQHALDHPIGTPRIRDLAKNARRVLLVADDISRPTPVARFVHLVIEELHQAGLRDEQIEFLMALGSHRLMTRAEMVHKLGEDVVNTYTVHNHDWTNPECLEYLGETDQGVPVWINTLVSQADVVIGLGAIMPIEVAGFTGGGKILVPGVCGVVTNSEMHWTRIGIDSAQILGKADNPVRASIDSLARKAGLDAIVNVVLNADSRIVGAVAGDMVEAHRVGCQRATEVFGVPMPQ